MVKYHHVLVKLQSSAIRCFNDSEYREMGVPVKDDVSDCEILIGVKEVPIENLIPNKTYLFFSHTIKKQSYNKRLLQEILLKKIRLIDYECLVDRKGERVIAFGYFAGIVGAHNGLMAYGQRTGIFAFPRANSFKGLDELLNFYKSITLPAMKIVITGGGRVAKGALEIMSALKIKKVSAEDFVSENFDVPVFVQLDSDSLYKRKDRTEGLPVTDFFEHPELYDCHFKPYYETADVMINTVFWNPKAPVFFTKEEMRSASFKIKTIADISCDINGSVPATIRATTIDNPVMGYNPLTGSEDTPYLNHVIDIMAIDNLPNELPRDASENFGDKMIHEVIPELLKPESDMIKNATIAENGELTSKFEYLKDFVQ
jgi:saccharopine dehydrogenase (NAD+, L-lysine forming)